MKTGKMQWYWKQLSCLILSKTQKVKISMQKYISKLYRPTGRKNTLVSNDLESNRRFFGIWYTSPSTCCLTSSAYLWNPHHEFRPGIGSRNLCFFLHWVAERGRPWFLRSFLFWLWWRFEGLCLPNVVAGRVWQAHFPIATWILSVCIVPVIVMLFSRHHSATAIDVKYLSMEIFLPFRQLAPPTRIA